jgi:hypothetical protein
MKFLLLSALFVATSCSPAADASAIVVSADITNAICSPIDPLDANPYVHFACTIAQAAQGIAATAVTVQVPTAQASDFAALHTALVVAPGASTESKRKAARK